MNNDLLPLATESPRCSDFAQSIELRPAGTGLFLNRVILVSVALPWPKPALKHELLAEAAQATQRAAVTSRLFAAEPFSAATTVEVYERQGTNACLYRWVLEDDAEIARLVTSIAETAAGDLTLVGDPDVVHQVAPTFLVCTQGSHDSCCGTSGVAMANQLEAHPAEWIVRRVSHTGGHRFSPTLMAFPEGRMWAFVDVALVERIAANTTTRADHLNHGRGWWGAKVGPAQAAEVAARAETAGQPFRLPLVTEIDVPDDADVKAFAVANDTDSWRVEVHVARQVPTVACESPGGLPVKPGREFGWSIERT